MTLKEGDMGSDSVLSMTVHCGFDTLGQGANVDQVKLIKLF